MPPNGADHSPAAGRSTSWKWNTTLLGYARVSTQQQDLERQLDALAKQGIPDERIRADKRTGATVDRPGLTALLAYARPGDTIVAYTLDRLGRNIRDVLNLIHELTERGIGLRTLADPMPIDTTHDNAMSRMAMHMLALFAEMERVYANERAAHAREVRRARGARVGRKRAHTDQAIEYAQLLRAQGNTIAQIVAKTGIPKASLYRYLNQSDPQEATA
jgi:DNA invertase Pin-like site-specific DNA recombinase